MEGLQPRTAVRLAGDGIAQRATQPFENGGLEQEAANQVGLTLQHLFDQIVHDIAVVAGERPDELANVVAPAQRERRQLKSGNPAFGAALQGGDVLLLNGLGEVLVLAFQLRAYGGVIRGWCGPGRRWSI